MKLDIISQAYSLPSAAIDAQTCINMYPIIDETGKDKSSLSYTPGLTSFANLSGGSSVRGLIETQSSLYAVIDNQLYTVSSTGVLTSVGTLSTSTGYVDMFANTPAGSNTQIAIADGTGYYVYTVQTNTFSNLTNASGFGGAINHLTMKDDFLVVVPPSKNQYQISTANDFTTWSALNVASAQSWGENIVSAKFHRNELWIFTSRGAEIWYNAGTSPFPFAKRADVTVTQGCAAANSVIVADNTIMWLTRNNDGQGMIVRNEYPYFPRVISTEAINYQISTYSTISDCIAWSMFVRGHQWCVWQFPTANATWVYDCTTKKWFQWSSLNSNPNQPSQLILGRHKSNCYAFCYGKHLVGDFASGNIFSVDFSTYTDNGTMIPREFTTKHFSQDLKRVSAFNLEVDIDAGQALLSGQGSNPQLMMQVSRDRGHTFGVERWVTAGATGQYYYRARWLTLGDARDWVLRFRMSDPVPWVILGAQVDIVQGDQ